MDDGAMAILLWTRNDQARRTADLGGKQWIDEEE
jgi:hypothetical protein